jgi:hypothetical protein
VIFTLPIHTLPHKQVIILPPIFSYQESLNKKEKRRSSLIRKKPKVEIGASLDGIKDLDEKHFFKNGTSIT